MVAITNPTKKLAIINGKWFKHIAIVKVPITIPITVPIPYNQSSLKASIGFLKVLPKMM